jgi:hypothetical protein
MQVIYPFESAAYNLKPNVVSAPVRTQFDITDSCYWARPSQGTITVASFYQSSGKGNGRRSDESKGPN